MRRGSRGDCPAVAHRPRGERPPDPALLRASLLRPSLDRSDPDGEIATTVARVSNWGRWGVDDVRGRSEERRVGNECVRPCSSRGSPYDSKKHPACLTHGYSFSLCDKIQWS